jgi:glycosyltransferase involved in cell wall biosynthesis
LRVLFLEAHLNDRGGAGRWLLDVVHGLGAGVDAHVGVGGVDPLLAPNAWPGAAPRVVKGLERKGLGSRGRRATLARLDALLDEVAPDVVHVNDVQDPAVLEHVAATGRGVVTAHDHRAFCPGRGKVHPDGSACSAPLGRECAACFDDRGYTDRMLTLTQRRLAALAAMARVVVVSRYMQAELAAVGVAPDRLVLAPPFVDPAFVEAVNAERARVGSAAPTFHVFAGRLAWQKGLRVALAAALQLRTSVPLAVAGDGPLASEVAAAVAAHPGRVRGLGWLDRRGLARLLAHTRALWFPSLWQEPFGLAGLEALAAGVPVIGTALGGTPDWLEHGVTGLVVPPNDPAALAAAADTLTREPALARELGANGRERAARFPREAALAALLATWRDVSAYSAR